MKKLHWITSILGSICNARIPGQITDTRIMRKYGPPTLIGHRGAAGLCPENTIISFDKALEKGAHYLEFDVQETSDGKLVVIHDVTVDRTTNGKGKVGSLSFEEIRKLDAGSWFHPRFKGEKIPSFSEVLERYSCKAGFLIELKKPSLYPGIEEKVAAELIKLRLHQLGKDRIIIQSFDKASLMKIKKLLPSIPVGVLVRHRPYGILERECKAISQFAQYLNPKVTMVNASLVKKAQKHSLKVIGWTAQDRQTAEELANTGLDGVVTDFVDVHDSSLK
ncbi:glycerophosphodiester phosphodiesterase [Mesobacillus zeae]|uniref:Glycerophosphodiester phosphodiesterase n=1 Tax=Mesobacillus zeae TaxID=1917180 RepID=A0A398BES3_9BACI|nr:glycerophosphodiester phosphodiesterase family protein [Mesobacillus zeae]RID87771.1 glycerophosphodiester phosphodiesterase [Mesobacillus zeae]